MACATLDWSHTTTLDAAPVSASEARAFVCEHLADHRLTDLVDPVRLVVSELATNVVVHARTGFSVTLCATAEAVTLIVRDGSDVVPAQRSARSTDADGRGLELVGLVSSDWGVSRDGAGSKTVWADFLIG